MYAEFFCFTMYNLYLMYCNTVILLNKYILHSLLSYDRRFGKLALKLQNSLGFAPNFVLKTGKCNEWKFWEFRIKTCLTACERFTNRLASQHSLSV
jgi:hypothetical protein